ncbi:unnamed protein product [Closterium sp. Yama58-4]|nr:unnamed protein product [Closterium sp. Yama58-4]
MASSTAITRAVLTRAVPATAPRVLFSSRVHSHSLAQSAAPERAASKRSRQWQIHATRADSRQDAASSPASPASPVSPSSAEAAKNDLKDAAPLAAAAPRESWGGFGFTKQNELFVGRVAMLGFAASLLGEAVTGQGILAQLNMETGIPVYEAEPLLLFFVLFNMLGAVGALGDRGKFVLEPVKPPVPPANAGWKGALGLVENGPVLGFTKSNELFVGRVAQLGFAASLIGEVITGKGALAQLNIETGVPVSEIEPLVILGIMLLFLSAINPGTGKFINDDDDSADSL